MLIFMNAVWCVSAFSRTALASAKKSLEASPHKSKGLSLTPGFPTVSARKNLNRWPTTRFVKSWKWTAWKRKKKNCLGLTFPNLQPHRRFAERKIRGWRSKRFSCLLRTTSTRESAPECIFWAIAQIKPCAYPLAQGPPFWQTCGICKELEVR